MLGIDKSRQAAHTLRLGNHLESNGGFTGRLRAEYLGHAAAGKATHAQSCVEADGSSGDNGDRQQGLFGAEADNRPLAKLLFDL